MAAPDVAEAVVGWRAWRVARAGGGLRLLSTLFDDVWEPEEALEAACRHGHRAPEAACACGIYGARDVTEAYRHLVGRDDPGVVHRVIGEVALWGRVIEHERGWRASLAYPARIWVPGGREDVLAGLAAYCVPAALDPEFASTSRPRPDSFAR